MVQHYQLQRQRLLRDHLCYVRCTYIYIYIYIHVSRFAAVETDVFHVATRMWMFHVPVAVPPSLRRLLHGRHAAERMMEWRLCWLADGA